jgi:hypothetical protein
MGIISFPEKVVAIPTELCATISGTGATLTVGNEAISSIAYTGSGVSTNLADAATGAGDIATPGAWTDLVDITGGPFRVQLRSSGGSNRFLYFAVNTAEDSTDAIRAQVIIDGTTVFDARTIADGLAVHSAYWDGILLNLDTNATGEPFDVTTSLKIRATRLGTFANASTVFYMGKVVYENVRYGS